ncbi:DUF4397 domain-containing protein [Chitinophaga sp. Cy-1792]|uniref:DUF4397 domain-containing protein n=1 Tax=Chitinophaga sp. Cy-1792 TaxID=2608339 RepID=UPI0014206629|nr:DUF4397 domain-containing protein [Chitinophaga sp. Cy-1792]NIG55365.1 DUF4397 domain-containing protein [Chitinophaga sp. Cy-1792]
MKKNIPCLLWVILIMAVVITSCSKEVTPEPAVSNNAGISFYNASYAVRKETNIGINFILIDSKDTTYKPISDLSYVKYPYFYNSEQYGYAFPILNRTQWIQHMRLPAGNHQLYLLDTARFVLDSSQVTLRDQRPVDVFYGDKYGQMKTLLLDDIFTPSADAAGVRIVNLSPSDKRVYLTVNGDVPASFPKDTYFGDHTAFLPVPVTGLDTLKIKVYAQGDDGSVMTRNSVEVLPGHAYTLVITGYDNDAPPSYKDPRTGITVGINSAFSITPIKNY